MICLGSTLSIWWYLSTYLPTYPSTYLIFNAFSQGMYTPRASLVAQRVKHLPAMWKTWVRSSGWEDPLEKEMATHSSTLAWKMPWMEKPGRLQSMGLQRVVRDQATSFLTEEKTVNVLCFICQENCIGFVRSDARGL